MIWLYLSSGRAAAIALVAYQGVSVALNIYSFTMVAFDSNAARALSVHVVWRIGAIVLLGLFIWRKPRQAAIVAETFH